MAFSMLQKWRLVVAVCIVIIAVIVTIVLLGKSNSQAEQVERELNVDEILGGMSPEQKHWYRNAFDELQDAGRIHKNTGKAKNVILFVGDGMGLNSITAARIHAHREEGRLVWETFPHIGLLKTYCMNKQVPDSASTATALFGGVKSNYETVGVTRVSLADCQSSLNHENHVESLLSMAQKQNMSTGFVTTTRVMHATPAALYAHSPDRRWECENKMPTEALRLGCKDIARQLIENQPGTNINVIMGGGRQCLISNVTGTEDDPIDTWSCYSTDGRDLIKQWALDKEQRGLRHRVVTTVDQLKSLDYQKEDFVLGIFANGHLPYEHERIKSPVRRVPSLQDMTESAIDILSKNPNGYVLIVEAGLVDQAHHRGWAKVAINEVISLERAVTAAIDKTKNEELSTLIAVTADHSHTLSISGYPKRGNNIFGIAQNSKADGMPYTTLSYATGHFGYQVEVNETTGKAQRVDPSRSDTTAFEYIQQATVFTDENTHGGSDVAVYAAGPMAHLFHRVHEQSYVGQVIMLAARIGIFANESIANALL